MIISMISLFLSPMDHYVETGNFWQDFLSVLLDPAHILSEIVFTIVFDGIIIYLGYQVFFKRIILPRIRKQIHEEVDEEHGVHHDPLTGAVSHEHGLASLHQEHNIKP